VAGLQHHVLLTTVAFLQHDRLTHRPAPPVQKRIGGPPPAPSLPAIRRLLAILAL
jgi:hypothetical protein